MVVSNDIAREDLECINHVVIVLGAMIKGVVAQGSFSVILLVRGKSSSKSGWILWVNNCLHR